MSTRYWLCSLMAAALFACGNNSGGNPDGGGSGDGDGDITSPDAPPFGGMCTLGGSQECSDCVDNDQDGKIDGFDPECTGPNDDREDSFATGIPGDNIDATMQDCFFDGNSGAGNDGCNQHACCLLQAGGATPATNDDEAACAMLVPAANAKKYKRADCYAPFGNTPVPDKCKMTCGPLAPPGCDCFGCCTICDAQGCEDIVLNPAVSPTCDQSNIHDFGPDGVEGTADDPCKRCTKTDCGNTTCGDETCVLCPGQDPTTLPQSCTGATCPPDIMQCGNDGSCPDGTWCSSGCCIGNFL